MCELTMKCWVLAVIIILMVVLTAALIGIIIWKSRGAATVINVTAPDDLVDEVERQEQALQVRVEEVAEARGQADATKAEIEEIKATPNQRERLKKLVTLLNSQKVING